MASASESGIDVNCTNFDIVITNVEGYKSKYNPPKPHLTAEALKKLAADTKQAVKDAEVAKAALDIVVSNRAPEFDNLSNRVTQIINGYEICGAPTGLITEARALVRKIRGERAHKFKKTQTTGSTEGEGSSKKSISVSQMGFSNRLGNYRSLITLLDQTTQYNPSEDELKVDNLWIHYNKLDSLNSAVIGPQKIYDDAIDTRNNFFNAEETGMVDILGDIKKYVLSVYGTKSNEYKAIAPIKITRIYRKKRE